MPPLVVDVMTAHRAALLRRERIQMQSMAQHWLTVERALRDEIVRFTERVHADGLTPSQIRSRQFQLDRFASLLRQVQTELSRYTDYATPLITEQQREYAATGIDNAADAINAVGEQAGMTIRFDRLPVAAVENMAGLAGDGSPLRTLLQGSFGVGAEGMFAQLLAGVALGRNPRVVARMMVRDGLSQSLTRMLLIARTEQLRVYRESSRQTYIHSGVVERYKRLASKSRRTCIACLMADGQVYDLDVPFEEHPAGRCQTVPVVAGLPPVQWTEGRDWFVTQSPDVQRAIMGPGRYNAWKEGVFDLDQLITRRENPTWGAALVPTPLRDLLNGKARPGVPPVRVTPPGRTTPRGEPSDIDVPTLALGNQSGDVAIPTVPRQRGPNGRPVSAALQLPIAGSTRQPVADTIAMIDSVHGDGILPTLPILQGSATMKQQGYYKFETGTNKPVEIKINRAAEHVMNTLAHEVGHFLEVQGVLPAVQGNPQAVANLAAVRSALNNTAAVRRLDALLAGTEKLTVMYGDIPITSGADPAYTAYLRQENEIWARAYAQYIAAKSKNLTMLEELKREQAYYYPVAWADDDFEPVVTAIDQLFETLGWMR